MHRTVIGWVIYGGGHCRRAKIFYLPQPGIKPGWLDLLANTLPHRCKSCFLSQGSSSVLLEILQYLDPVTYSSGLLLHNIHMWPDLAMPVKVYIQYQGVLVLKFGRKKKQGKKTMASQDI